MKTRIPTTGELDELAGKVEAAPKGAWRTEAEEGVAAFALRTGPGEVPAQLFARKEVGAALVALFDAAREELPRLGDAVRSLQEEIEGLHRERDAWRDRARREDRPEPRAKSMEIDEDAPLGLSAAFHVGPREAKAAQTDPLTALAVQVSRALMPEAKEIERARLIAMAFAATRGDMDGFWSARKQRTTKEKAVKNAVPRPKR